MLIAVLSDLHFGFGDGELWDDSFEAVEEAIEKSREADIILIAGDLFDTRVPTPETLVRAMQLFIKPIKNKNSVKIVEGINKDISEIQPITKSGTPVIAINGNHDRRTKGFINPVQALEKAGFLIHLHCNGIILEKEEERVCIHGMSAVPDQYFESVMKQWAPEPVKGCKNILMLHHLLSPFTFSTQKIEIIPKGFDLYICGDLHEQKKSYYSEAPFLIPGSAIPTQINRESVNPKGFWVFDSAGGTTRFVELEKNRRVYYIEKDFQNTEEIESEIKNVLGENHGKKPILRINIQNRKEFPLNEIKNKYQANAIISFRKEADETKEAKTMEQQRLSVKEMGRNILLRNLKEAELDEKIFEDIFELLLENNPDKALELLRRQK